LLKAFDPRNPNTLVTYTTRTTDDLSDRVKGRVQWRDDLPDHPTGYYLFDPADSSLEAVEFINNYWHFIFRYTGNTFTSLENRIEPNSLGTGYWYETDRQHPNFSEHFARLQRIAASRTPSPQTHFTEGAGPSSTPAPHQQKCSDIF
jgi:hypothetical protein